MTVATDRAVLEHLFETTGGEDWTDKTNWLTDAPLSTWFGVSTDVEGRVADLSLRRNNLVGRIPSALGELDRLFSLRLNENELHGRVPAELAKLKRLRDLILSRNELDGSLPAEMGSMVGLEYLSVSSTNVSGPIPEAWAQSQAQCFLLRRYRVVRASFTRGLAEDHREDDRRSRPLCAHNSRSGRAHGALSCDWRSELE